MPFERPTLSELVERVRSDLRGRLGIRGSLVRRTTADVLASVWAGAVHMLHGHLEWLAVQLFGDTADRDHLLRQASLYGLRPIPATFAAGTAWATGADDSVIPVDTVLVRDDGATYTVTAEVRIANGTALVPIQAVAAGTAGNLAAGETLVFESPISGSNSTATVAGIDGGNDEESTESLRARLLLRLREPPQGGAAQDYKAWALEVAGVTRAWVFPREQGLGTVTVRFVRDGDPDIVPSAADVAAVQAHIDAQRPITAQVTVAAPIPRAVDFSIAVTPDTAATRAAVAAELADVLFRDAAPGDGAGAGTIRRSQILVAVGVANGVTDFDVFEPASDVVPAVGELAVVGVVTWVS